MTFAIHFSIGELDLWNPGMVRNIYRLELKYFLLGKYLTERSDVEVLDKHDNKLWTRLSRLAERYPVGTLYGGQQSVVSPLPWPSPDLFSPAIGAHFGETHR
ncbi:hypothetical protein TNCV_4095791 [Trichonephila clavipes]|uniref:Uncharacterized protein n=1 Tax=Trichonephila clavipes TaxID=2585209 RepID=A0A8X6S6H6_TRICX|nr:hypothetical protein TNCV_4095791 [Trichonephila clavipes]